VAETLLQMAQLRYNIFSFAVYNHKKENRIMLSLRQC